MREYCRIADDVELGKDVQIHGFVNLYGCKIGDGTRLGTFVEVQKNAAIGARCKISSHTFICEGVRIEDEVFVGHGVMFTNVLAPRATNAGGGLQTEDDWEVMETIIKRRAAIGSGAVVLCGNTIGEGAIVGAGAVVTRSIPDGEIWVGNPARFLRKVNPDE
jgi:acetyltransferase-like isoleucine patch superfamily enzyme